MIVGDTVEGRESLEVWFPTTPSDAGTTSVYLPRPACDDRNPGMEVLPDLIEWA
jgi:hypothetical protein